MLPQLVAYTRMPALMQVSCLVACLMAWATKPEATLAGKAEHRELISHRWSTCQVGIFCHAEVCREIEQAAKRFTTALHAHHLFS